MRSRRLLPLVLVCDQTSRESSESFNPFDFRQPAACCYGGGINHGCIILSSESQGNLPDGLIAGRVSRPENKNKNHQP